MASNVSSDHSLKNKLTFDPALKLSKENFEVDEKDAFKFNRPWRSKIEELQNVAPFPSAGEFAIFVSNAYKDRHNSQSESDLQEKTPLPDGWKLLTATVHNSRCSVANGYHGTAFWNPVQRQVIIIHHGTVPDDSQMNSACTFTHKVYFAIEKIDDVSKWQFFFTGHSLGAWLAQITTFALKYLTVEKTKFSRNPSIGLHAHTEVFDSLGCYEMLSQMASDFDVRYRGKMVDINKLDITSYMSSPNTITCRNSHVGVLFRIYPETADTNAILTFFEHGVKSLNNIKMKRVVIWPKLQPSDPKLTEEYGNFFKFNNNLNDFDSELDKNILSTPIRYQVTEAVREISFCETVFTEMELEILQAFQWLIKIPEFFKPETFFDDLTKDEIKDIVHLLGKFNFRDYSVTCTDGNPNLRGMVTFAKALIRIFPELRTKTRDALKSLEARKQIYVNTTTQYLKKLENFVSTFRSCDCPKLLSFIKDSDIKMVHMETDYSTDLAMARVVKFLEPFWDSFDNHFAMEIQTFIAMSKSFELKQIIPEKSLVLLECKDAIQNETLIDLINILTTINSFKILLVTRKTRNQNQIETYIRNNLKNCYLKIPWNGFKFNDLNEKSRANLLSNKAVRFQGNTEKISLIDLIGNDSFEVDDVFDSLTLTKLIKNETITIGSELEDLKEIKHYYIPRIFEYEINPKEVIQEGKKGLTSIFSEDVLLKELSDGEIVIISDVAGMGKSTVLTSLGLKLKEKLPHLWIIRVNLNDCTEALLKLLANDKSTYFTKENPSLAVKFLLNEILFNKDAFETKILHHILSSSSSSCVVIFFDAFDKISPNYDAIVIQLLVSLRYSRVRNIFVANRPHTSLTLEKNLGTTAIKMVPLVKKSQIEFLMRFWIFKTQPDKQGFIFLKDKIKLAYDCIKSLSGLLIQDVENEFMGNPLHCRILAEYINTIDTKAVKISNISFIEMYESFVRSKFDIYRRDKGLEVKSLRALHQMLALQLVMGKQEQLLIDEDIKIFQFEVLKVGIVIEMTENVIFVHRTFAEYFVVDYLLTRNDSVKSTAITNEILLQNEHYVLRNLLNSVLKSEQRRREFLPILRNYVNDVRCSFNESYFTNEMGETALMVALKEKRKFIYNFLIDILLEKKGSYDTISNYIHWNSLNNTTALHYACEFGSIKCVKRLVENPPSKKFFKWTNRNILNEKNGYGVTPLLLACRESHIAIALYLIANGADVNISNMAGKTPLHSAVRYGSKKIVSSLIKNGAEIDVTDKGGWTPLQLAINCDKYEIALLLTKNGANVNRAISYGNLSMMYSIFTRSEKSTLLHYVAKQNWCKVVKQFIQNGAVIDTRDWGNRTPLHLAAGHLSPSTAHLLIKNGADVSAVDMFGDSLLHIAACNDYYVLKYTEPTNKIPIVCEYLKMNATTDNNRVRYPFEFLRFNLFKTILPKLLENGVDINARNVYGETPLHKATRSGRFDIVKLLSEHGAQINTFTNGKGWGVKYTPLHIAARLNQFEIAKFLLDNGADRDASNDQNQTPLSLAVEKGYDEMIELLSKYNINQ